MILDSHGRPMRSAPPGGISRLRATYDAAQFGSPLQKHWTAADWFSPNAAANPNVRRTVRARARYEVANNAFARGIVTTLANYVVGTGPVLRLIPREGTSPRTELAIMRKQQRFNEWAWSAQLSRHLHTMQMSKTTDGDGLAMMINRDNVPKDKVQLGLRTFEAEMLSNPADFTFYILDRPEGIDLGPDGQPKTYWVLKHHPGGGFFMVYPTDATAVPAASVCHWFDESRPGLMRGLPEIMPSLSVFAMLRRYTAAVVTAAETAADFAGFMQTDTPATDGDEGGAASLSPGSVMDIERGQITALPDGWKMAQMKAEHPGQMHEPFLRTLIREAGRPLDMPYAVAAMDASGHNYSSMRGDWQAFFASLGRRRQGCEHQVLDKIEAAWNREDDLLNGALPADCYDAEWDWPSFEPIDAEKDAAADSVRLQNLTISYAEVYSKRAKDWQVGFKQIAREKAMMKDLNLMPDDVAPPPVNDDKGGNAKASRRRRRTEIEA